MLASWCVCAIKCRLDLDAAVTNRKATFVEQKRWTVAARLLDTALRNGEDVPIVFAAAEETDELIAWGLLEKVDVNEHSTTYTVSSVQSFDGRCRPRKTILRKRSDGLPLSARFIRSYAICATPPVVEIGAGTRLMEAAKS
jgi:hypothetical protein